MSRWVMDGPTLHAISRALVYEAEPMGSIKETLSNQLTNGLLQNAAVRAARGLNQRGAPVADRRRRWSFFSINCSLVVYVGTMAYRR